MYGIVQSSYNVMVVVDVVVVVVVVVVGGGGMALCVRHCDGGCERRKYEYNTNSYQLL